MEEKATELDGSTISGSTVGEPFAYDGEQYRALVIDISKSVRDYALRVAGTANALGASGTAYGSADSENATDFGEIQPGGAQ